MIDILGYKILERTVKDVANGQVIERRYNLIVKSDKKLYFETDNNVFVEQLNETTASN